MRRSSSNESRSRSRSADQSSSKKDTSGRSRSISHSPSQTNSKSKSPSRSRTHSRSSRRSISRTVSPRPKHRRSTSRSISKKNTHSRSPESNHNNNRTNEGKHKRSKSSNKSNSEDEESDNNNNNDKSKDNNKRTTKGQNIHEHLQHHKPHHQNPTEKLPDTLLSIQIFSQNELTRMWRDVKECRKTQHTSVDLVIETISTKQQWRETDIDALTFAITKIWKYEEKVATEETKLRTKNDNKEILSCIKNNLQIQIEKITKDNHSFKITEDLENLTTKEKLEIAKEIFTEKTIYQLDRNKEKAEKKILYLLQKGWPTLKYANITKQQQQYYTSITDFKETLTSKLIDSTQLQEDEKSMWNLFVEVVSNEVLMLTQELKGRVIDTETLKINDWKKTEQILKNKIEEQQKDIDELERKMEEKEKYIQKKAREFMDTRTIIVKLEEDIMIKQQEQRKLEIKSEKKDLFLKTLYDDAAIEYDEDSISQLRQHYGKENINQTQPTTISTLTQNHSDTNIKSNTTKTTITWTTHAKHFQKELGRRGITTFRFGGNINNQKNAEHFLNVWDQLMISFPFDDANKIIAFRSTIDVGDTTTRGLMAALENKKWEEYYLTLKQTAGLTNDSPSHNILLLIDLQQTTNMSVTEYYGRFYDILQKTIAMPEEMQIKWFIRGLLQPLQEPLERWLQEQTTTPTLTQTKNKAQAEYHIKFQPIPPKTNTIASIYTNRTTQQTTNTHRHSYPPTNFYAEEPSEPEEIDVDSNTHFAIRINDVNAINTVKSLQPQAIVKRKFPEYQEPSRNNRTRTDQYTEKSRYRRSTSPQRETNRSHSDKSNKHSSPSPQRHSSSSHSNRERYSRSHQHHHSSNTDYTTPAWAIPEKIWREARKTGYLYGVPLPTWEKTTQHRSSSNTQIDLQAIDEAYQNGARQLLPRRRLTPTRKEDFFVDDEQNAYCLIHDTYGNHSTYRCPFNALRENPNFLYFPDQEEYRTRMFEQRSRGEAERLRCLHEERRL